MIPSLSAITYSNSISGRPTGRSSKPGKLVVIGCCPAADGSVYTRVGSCCSCGPPGPHHWALAAQLVEVPQGNMLLLLMLLSAGVLHDGC